MKHLFLALVALLTASTAFSAAGFPTPSDVETLLNNGGQEASRAVQLGTQLARKKPQLMIGLFDYAVNGGAISTATNLKDVDGKDAVIPNNAVITRVMTHALTAVASTGSATVSLGANTTNDLLSAAAKTTLDGTDEMSAGIQDGAAANAVVTTEERTLTATIGTSIITAGKFEVFVEYYLGQ